LAELVLSGQRQNFFDAEMARHNGDWHRKGADKPSAGKDRDQRPWA
jgi:hypothetical protein